jgi:hypothetical protein
MVEVEPSRGHSLLQKRLGKAGVEERWHQLYPEDIAETELSRLSGLDDADVDEPSEPILGDAGFRRDLLRGEGPRHRPIVGRSMLETGGSLSPELPADSDRLDRAPGAFLGVRRGANVGKVFVR